MVWKFVVTEIARTHPGGDYQEVVLQCSTANPRTISHDDPSPEIYASHLPQQYSEVTLFRPELADWRRYLGG